MTSILRIAGRALGMLAGGALCLVWLVVIWFPTEQLSISGFSIVVAGFMAFLSLVAAIASFHGHVIVLGIVFVASFLPVGGYLLGVNHWLRFVGILDIILLVGALMILAGNRLERKKT